MQVDFTKVQKGILTENVPVDTFQCIEPNMETYIKNTAFTDQEKNLGRTWCWVEDRKILLGFITLATFSIDKKDMPEEKHGKFPYDTIPSLLIGQLAANKNYQGNRLGLKMLDFAIKQAYHISENVGCKLVALHPLPNALPWYEKNTPFKPLKRNNGKKDIMYYNMWEYSQWDTI